MKAHLIDTHLLVPRSRSSAKVKVKYQGHVFQKMGVSGALVFHKHVLFFLAFKNGICGLKKFLLNTLNLTPEGPSCKTVGVSVCVQSTSFCQNAGRSIKGGYLDFSHLTKLRNIYITEIYMKKQYK